MNDVRLAMPWWYVIIIVILSVVAVMFVQCQQFCKECKMGVCRVHPKYHQQHFTPCKQPQHHMC